MSIRVLFSVGLFLVAQTGPGASVAVAPFHNATGRGELDPLCYGLPELVSAALGTATNISMVDRTSLDAVIAEQGLSFATGQAADAGVTLGQLVHADTMLVGSFMESDEQLQVTVQAIDVESAVIVGSRTHTGVVSNLVALCEGIARDVAGVMVNGDAYLHDIPIDTSPVANLHVMRGLQDYWRGDYTMAIASFMRARDTVPKHADAIYWTVRSYVATEDWAHALIDVTRFMETCDSDPRLAEVAELRSRCVSKLTDRERELLLPAESKEEVQ